MIEVQINKEDIKKNVYFILSMVQSLNGPMHGRTSSKGDLIGGIFDRWINTTTEKLIFQKVIVPECTDRDDVEIVSDYYKYNPKDVGNAPDVLGIRIGETIVPFATFDNGWIKDTNKPQVEVKTLKEKQRMASLVVERGYTNMYIVMLESNISVAYLLPFISQDSYSHEIYDEMLMRDDIFIVRDENNAISMIEEVNAPTDYIGTIKIMHITKGFEFVNNSNFCDIGVSPVPIDLIEEKPNARGINKNSRTKLSNYVELQGNGLYRYKDKWYKKDKNGNNVILFPDKKIPQRACYLDFHCSNIEAIRILKKTDRYIVIKSLVNCRINEYDIVKDKIYKISYSFSVERADSKNGEYFIQKTLIGYIPNYHDMLIQDFKNIIEEYE